MARKGIPAGRAYVSLMTDDSSLRKGLRKAQQRLDRFGSGVKLAGLKMIGMGAALLAPLALATKVFAGFEQQMANVSTMVDDTARHMGTFRKAILDMSVEFGESTEALAGGLYDILSASIPAAEAIGVLDVAVRAAKAGMTDTKTASDAITTILNAYGLAASEAGSVSDWLFSVVKRGKTTFAELAPQIGMVASTAASAGVSVEELGAMIATLTGGGVQTTNAVTATNAIIMGFLKPTAEAAAAARALGFEMSSATLSSEGLVGVMERLQGLPADVIAMLFPNVRALRGVIPAIKHFEGFSHDIALMGRRAGTTQIAYDKMTKTVAHGLARVKQAALKAVTVISEGLGPSMKEYADKLVETFKSVSDWVSQNSELVTSILSVTAKVGVATIALGGMLLVVGQLTTAVSALIGGFGLLVAHPVVAVLAGITVAAVAVSTALSVAANRTAELNAEMKDVLKTGDKQREADLLRMERLQQLAEKEELNNVEMSEAKQLIDELTTRYGDLGIKLDATTGKLTGLTEAQKKFNAAIREAALAEIDAAILEQTHNRDAAMKLYKEMYREKGWYETLTSGTIKPETVKKREQDALVATAKLKALKLRRKSLLQGYAQAAIGPVEGPEPFTVEELQKNIAAGKAEADRKRRPKKTGDSGLDEKLRKLLEGIGGGGSMEDLAAMTSGRGTFSAATAGRLGFGDATKRMSTSLSSIDKKISDLIQTVRESAPEFAP